MNPSNLVTLLTSFTIYGEIPNLIHVAQAKDGETYSKRMKDRCTTSEE